MANAASTAGDRVQLLVLVDAADALARYCVFSIDPTLFAAAPLTPGSDGAGCNSGSHINFIEAAGAEHESLAAWLRQKQRVAGQS
jgi:hypothetical protein